jgi:hypothetical protein
MNTLRRAAASRLLLSLYRSSTIYIELIPLPDRVCPPGRTGSPCRIVELECASRIRTVNHSLRHRLADDRRGREAIRSRKSIGSRPSARTRSDGTPERWNGIACVELIDCGTERGGTRAARTGRSIYGSCDAGKRTVIDLANAVARWFAAIVTLREAT